MKRSEPIRHENTAFEATTAAGAGCAEATALAPPPRRRENAPLARPAGSPTASPRHAGRSDVTLPPAPPQPRSLRLNASWALTGNLVYAACQWGMLVVLAKLGSPEMVGQFALALAVTAPIVMLSMLQLRAVQATDAKGEYEFGHYLALRLVTSMLALLAIAVAAYLSGYRVEIALLILAVGLFKAVESVSDAYHGLMQKHERMDRIALAQIIKGPLFLAALAAAVLYSGSVLMGVAAMTVGSLAMLIGYERVNALRLLGAGDCHAGYLRWEWARLAQLARLAFPLGIVMMLASLNTNIPRYFIERELGERELGYFAALAYLQVMHCLLGDAVGHAITSRLSRYYSSNDRKAFLRLLTKAATIGLLAGFLIIAVVSLYGYGLLAVIYRPEYAAHAPVLLCLMVAAMFSTLAGCFNCAILGARRFHATLLASTTMLLMTLLAAGILVPAMGLMGAAVATLCGSIARFTCSTALVFLVVRQMPIALNPLRTSTLAP